MTEETVKGATFDDVRLAFAKAPAKIEKLKAEHAAEVQRLNDEHARERAENASTLRDIALGSCRMTSGPSRTRESARDKGSSRRYSCIESVRGSCARSSATMCSKPLSLRPST